mgnify:CR=1 FL=1
MFGQNIFLKMKKETEPQHQSNEVNTTDAYSVFNFGLLKSLELKLNPDFWAMLFFTTFWTCNDSLESPVDSKLIWAWEDRKQGCRVWSLVSVKTHGVLAARRSERIGKIWENNVKSGRNCEVLSNPKV